MSLKKVLNLHEAATHKRLQNVCAEYGAQVFSKMRLADIFPIDGSRISKDLYRFALQSHFDFTVVDSEHNPLFAVEFDGPTHNSEEQKIRDEKKSRLCERFGFPLLRINANHLLPKYREYDLLSWFVEVWFLERSFNEAQEEGQIPGDEPFDPMMFIYLDLNNPKKRFPLWLSAELRVKIHNLRDKGRCFDFAPSEWIGFDDQGNLYGLAWLRITESRGVVAKTAMRNQRFPVMLSDLLSEILVFQIYEELSLVLEGKKAPVMKYEFGQVLTEFSQKYRVIKNASFISNDEQHTTGSAT